MFKDRTLFVLGAGASYDFGFPLGSSLKTAIMEAIQFDLDPIHERPRYTSDSELVFRSASVEWRKDWGEIHDLASQISGGLGFASSIDTFLHLRRESPGIAVLAKHAIAHAIASRERANESLKLSATSTTRVRSSQFDKNWVQIFSEICFDGADQSQLGLAFRRFRVISFNYDRCLEQFIRIAARSIYNLDEARSESFCQSLAFIHPYGSLGALSTKEAKRLDFGSSRA